MRFLIALAAGAAFASGLAADPLSKKVSVDFFRQVSSRNLHGLAVRSDGRLVAGPTLTELSGTAPAELLWCLEPAGHGRWLVGTGPEASVFEVQVDLAKGSFTARPAGSLGHGHIFALAALPNGDILAGTSPRGELALIRAGKVAARVALPVDSIFDLVLVPMPGRTVALAATGNPARIYRIDLKKFAVAGDVPDKLRDSAQLGARGITLFGEVRDSNIRRLARLSDGRIAAGSSPKGNVYVFDAPRAAPPAGTDPEAKPLILDENRNAEITDLLPVANGDFYASLVANGGADFRSTVEKAKAATSPIPPQAELPSFSGRGILGRFPGNGFPEALLSRSGTAFYRLAEYDGQILMAGGEEGEFTGFDPDAQLALTYAGSQSARLTDMAPVPGAPGKFLLLRNNAPGLALADFNAAGLRQAETNRIDLGLPSRIGAIRIDHLRDIDPRQVQIDIRTSHGSDELEGWTDWRPLLASGDGWRADGLRGRYIKLRVRLPAAASQAELDKADVYYLPQDRRPEMQEFHFISPNYALVPQPDPAPSVTATLSQLMQAKDDDKHKSTFLSSQVVPSPGAQVAFWTVNDPDGDNLVYTFSIRRQGDAAWTDLAVDIRDSYVQFDTLHLRDGIYFTRLVAKEAAPRPEADRLSAKFETDDLVVDHTPPDILDASVERQGGHIFLRVHGRDALSLLDGIEAVFNNGDHEEVEQPADGIRDGREETFVLDEPAARATGASAVDVTLYDAAGNGTTRRLAIKP